ncbi:hypothetical protein [Christensenella timonensis]|uniref:hypothetical protein n=1 Tax=Christensenella timonensis TaxID=1816678 RepID=UPI00082F2260|nr:hypothetical protein [Christensenella timonensis]
MGATFVAILLIIAFVLITNGIIRTIAKKKTQFPKVNTTLWTIIGALVGFVLMGAIFVFLGPNNNNQEISQIVNLPMVYLVISILLSFLGVLLFIYGIKKEIKTVIALSSSVFGITAIAWFFTAISNLLV